VAQVVGVDRRRSLHAACVIDRCRACEKLLERCRAGGRVVHRSGPGALPGIAGRSFRMGTTFTFIYSSPNYFGRYKVARVSPAGLSVVRSGCTPPGKTTFVDCKKVKG